VPGQPEDYIHRVGRTARARTTGDAVTFAAPQERNELAAIERAVGRSIPRRRLEGFDYDAEPGGRFEVPAGERIAAIRARKAEERARARAKAERKAQQGHAAPASSARRSGGESAGRGRPAQRAEPAGRGRGRRR
jgi:ATP-dependent RNA helicase RhlE